MYTYKVGYNLTSPEFQMTYDLRNTDLAVVTVHFEQVQKHNKQTTSLSSISGNIKCYLKILKQREMQTS